MPRVSDKRLLIEWFLENLQSEILKDFLGRKARVITSRVIQALRRGVLEPWEEDITESLIDE